MLVFLGVVAWSPARGQVQADARVADARVADASVADASVADASVASASVADAIAAMEQEWSGEYAEYWGLELGEVEIQVEEIAAKLTELEQATGQKGAVLWLMSKPDALNLALTTPDTLAVSRDIAAANANALMQTMREFQREVSQPRNLNSDRYLGAASRLYDWMIAPIADVLRRDGIDLLLICGGNGLRSFPFAALYDQANQQFLVEQFSLAQIPAFNLLNTAAHRLDQATVLAMGASEFQEQAPLPGVETELANIPSRWRDRAFLNSEFTQKRLRRERRACNCDIVHLATHADFNAGTPQDSYIQFFRDRLELDDIERFAWDDPPVELVVLSACETAAGNAEAELGFAGLIVKSGARSALASLWYISDLGTVGVMGEFYHALQTAPTKAVALQQAQLAMLRGQVAIADRQLQTRAGAIDLDPVTLTQTQNGQTFTHPFYWAAYTLIGNAW
ncbi:CHAT domain-containing protein [Spirulina major CS-329]|uniref:CHAT domain-containing protein n=1 Tax=Spirulina TaxID=1154 RepID=UPI00232FBB14|nr:MULTISPECIES: CHAT domain-containing protein [Spirulina]MDB9495632.1 CHAT domain-containing protein [Spirulina subsalsa CS-330]MDB9502884.1 CHAT domain-containing protein [Spirulina major CS-329]